MIKKKHAQTSAPIRTALFVPGSRPDRIDKAMGTLADMVIIDLEDAVAPAQKDPARVTSREKIGQFADRRNIVRVNALGTGMNRIDLEHLVSPQLQGIMLPKVETPEDVQKIHQRLTALEASLNLDPGSIAITVLIESARGVQNVDDILSVKIDPPRHLMAAFGAADYALDMGIDITRDGTELILPRSKIALASRAAERDAPLDTPFMIDLKDTHALETDALRAKQLGFQGKLCIHPAQVGPCNTIFSPRPEEIDFARQVIEADRVHTENGEGAFQINGKFIDPPVVARCRKILALASKLDQST